MFLLVSAHPGSPRQRDIKLLCVCVTVTDVGVLWAHVCLCVSVYVSVYSADTVEVHFAKQLYLSVCMCVCLSVCLSVCVYSADTVEVCCAKQLLLFVDLINQVQHAAASWPPALFTVFT